MSHRRFLKGLAGALGLSGVAQLSSPKPASAFTGAISASTINESIANAGVTVDGLLIRDGTVGITVQEQDGAPSITGIRTIRFPTDSLIDQGNGVVYVSSGSASYPTDPVFNTISVGSSSTFGGPLNVPGIGACQIKAGNGDGANLNTNNMIIRSWWGVGFKGYDDGAYNASLNCRTGEFATRAASLYLEAGAFRTHRHPYADNRHIESGSIAFQWWDNELDINMTWVNAFNGAPRVMATLREGSGGTVFCGHYSKFPSSTGGQVRIRPWPDSGGGKTSYMDYIVEGAD